MSDAIEALGRIEDRIAALQETLVVGAEFDADLALLRSALTSGAAAVREEYAQTIGRIASLLGCEATMDAVADAIEEGAEAVEVLRAWGEARVTNACPDYDWIKRAGLTHSSVQFCAAAYHETQRVGSFVPAAITTEMVNAASERMAAERRHEANARALADRLSKKGPGR